MDRIKIVGMIEGLTKDAARESAIGRKQALLGAAFGSNRAMGRSEGLRAGVTVLTMLLADFDAEAKADG